MKKLVADRLKAQVAGPHPDAEVLSAFAENALPASERDSVLQHLSTCSNCRDVLFLAAPSQSEPQQVLAAPRARPFFALRWGTLAACVLIAAVFLVSRHQAPRTQQLAKSVPQSTNPSPSSSYAEPAIVAAEKTPAELSELRDKLPAKVSAAPVARTGHAEPKHITAKPEGSMTFADSGEVRLRESPSTLAYDTPPAVVQALPSAEQNAVNFKRKAGDALSSNETPRTAGGVAGGVISANGWSSQAVANAPARKDLAAYGYVAGTVLDASGAVVPNVRVTAIGPVGTQTATSDQGGKYVFNQLKAGNYQLSFDAPGFRQVQYQQVAVLPNQAANMDVKLQPGATAETVEVTAAAVPVTAQADTAAQIQQQNVNRLQAGQEQTELSSVQTAEVHEKKRSARGAAAPEMARSAALLVWQWSLSPEGLVERSADRGATWQVVRIARGLTFHAISSFANHVWVGGKAGVLYHSADTGNHWTRVVPAAREGRMQGDVTQIQFADPQHGIVTTSNAEVWTTADGGQTWARR